MHRSIAGPWPWAEPTAEHSVSIWLAIECIYNKSKQPCRLYTCLNLTWAPPPTHHGHCHTNCWCGQPKYKNHHWHSLQPNIFATRAMAPTLDLIKEHRRTGRQGPLSMIMDIKSPHAVIDACDVGVSPRTFWHPSRRRSTTKPSTS
jgi:hypothetical protein